MVLVQVVAQIIVLGIYNKSTIMKRKPTFTNHENQLKILGRYFREFRFNYGLTQNELSENTNIHRRTIQRLEGGENVTLESLLKIADFFEIDLIKDLTGIKTE